MKVRLVVNEKDVTAEIEDRTTLLDLLRDHLGLTGTKVGCEQGVCGCCNVLLDGEVVRSCLVLAGQARNAKVTTIEGIGGSNGEMSHLQQAFYEHHAMQCGYCTPGIIVALHGAFEEHSEATRDDVIETLAGNLCRCTGYQQILDAVFDAMSRRHSIDAMSRKDSVD